MQAAQYVNANLQMGCCGRENSLPSPLSFRSNSKAYSEQERGKRRLKNEHEAGQGGYALCTAHTMKNLSLHLLCAGV